MLIDLFFFRIWRLQLRSATPRKSVQACPCIYSSCASPLRPSTMRALSPGARVSFPAVSIDSWSILGFPLVSLLDEASGAWALFFLVRQFCLEAGAIPSAKKCPGKSGSLNKLNILFTRALLCALEKRALHLFLQKKKNHISTRTDALALQTHTPTRLHRCFIINFFYTASAQKAPMH